LTIDLTAVVPCHLVGAVELTLEDEAGTPVPLSGNPVARRVDAELSPWGSGLHLAYAMSARTCVPSTATVELTGGGVAQSFEDYSPESTCQLPEPTGARISLRTVRTVS
jgi:hypothetical protein